jgi:hypothetical protein
MSEYQYYEFTAVDRPLDDRQLDELRSLSTRAQITPTSFVNTYNWGDFRGDPQTLMGRYFDAFLYLANWGTRRLMIRLPGRLLDLTTAQRYCSTDAATAWADGDYVIFEFVSEHEDGDWDTEGEGWLTSIIPVRADLAAGDLRCLYLGWLLSIQDTLIDDADEEEQEENASAVEPPVPPGLSTLTASLRSFAEFLRIDDDLLTVAATASPEQSPAHDPTEGDLAGWVERLPTPEKDELLVRVMRGDTAHLRAELLRRFRGDAASGDVNTGGRTVAALLSAAEAHRAERERLAEERRTQERLRRERAAAVARDKHLDALALREEQAWDQVEALINTKKPRDYDTAVTLLADLRAVGDRKGEVEAFERRFHLLCGRHTRKPSFIERLERAGLPVATV